MDATHKPVELVGGADLERAMREAVVSAALNVEGEAKVGAVKERPRSPISGAPVPIGRQKGTPNKVTRTIREAVERAARDCHPDGLAGWLVERAQGTVQDRQIFAAMVNKAMPLQVQAQVGGGIKLELSWLGGRSIGTTAAQSLEHKTQVLDLEPDSGGTYKIKNPAAGDGAGSAGPAAPADSPAAAQDGPQGAQDPQL